MEHIKWTAEEWTAVAKRTAAMRASHPEASWLALVPLCQDDIAPERRRLNFNKLSGLKPMFDILDLDEVGNPKPPPPPPPAPEPEPEPEPAPVLAPVPASELSKIPIDQLITEIFTRGTTLKTEMDGLTRMGADIKALLAENNAKLELALKRVDEVEKEVLSSMEAMDKINQTYADMRKASGLLKLELDNQFDGKSNGGGKGIRDEFLQATLLASQDLGRIVDPTPEPKLAPVRFLLLGPFHKDVQRIKERLPRSFNVQLLLGENSENATFPANIDHCLVSGHNDFTRRWQSAYKHYGDRARRMANGSLGTFIHAIEQLYVQHLPIP